MDILSREEFDRWADMEGHAEPLARATIEALAEALGVTGPFKDGFNDDKWSSEHQYYLGAEAELLDTLREKGWL